MRISSNIDDPGYDAWMDNAGRVIRIFVNGDELQHCITADEEEGYVIRHARDEEGYFILDGDYIRSEIIHGDVQIEIY